MAEPRARLDDPAGAELLRRLGGPPGGRRVVHYDHLRRRGIEIAHGVETAHQEIGPLTTADDDGYIGSRHCA